MPQIVFPANTDLLVQGTINATTNKPSAGAVADASVAAYAGTGTGISASKLQQRFDSHYAQESATNAASEARVAHVVRGANGTIQDFYAGAVVLLTGADTCTVDLKKNGSSILTAAISLLSSDTVRVAKAGSLSSASVVAGDVLEVVVTATHSSGTLPKGVFARVSVTEDPS